MKAEVITVAIIIRPSYGSAATVREEVTDSLSWLTDDHRAVVLSWLEPGDQVTTDGAWIDAEGDDDDDA